jgi:hypothetical protein
MLSFSQEVDDYSSVKELHASTEIKDPITMFAIPYPEQVKCSPYPHTTFPTQLGKSHRSRK